MRFSFIDEGMKHGAVLVHCAAGFSRSVALAIGYLMKQRNWSFEESFKFVKLKRNSKYTNPNFGFLKQLKDYEQELNISRRDN
jgi:dual specificity MAP kinase phosphatase